MILNIILLIIIFQLFLERVREGMTDEIPEKKPIDIETPDLGIVCDPNINVKFPWYDKVTNTYTNKNKFVSNQYDNILKYATTPCG